MEDLENFSIRIKQLRESLKMTQKEFSDRIGIKQQTLSGYERGIMNPTLDVVKRISDNFSISIDWLCGLSDNEIIGNNIRKYSDVINILCELEKTEIDLLVFTVPAPQSIPFFRAVETIPVITFNNLEMYRYLKDLSDLLNLRDNYTIKRELYDLWIKQKKEELNKNICFDSLTAKKQFADE